MKRLKLYVEGKVHIYERLDNIGMHVLIEEKDIDAETIKFLGRGKISTITPNWIDYKHGYNVVSVDCSYYKE